MYNDAGKFDILMVLMAIVPALSAYFSYGA